ncbi:MAG: hypothetical protein AAFX81_04655 [Pseudomonadota bacterium]
MRFAVMFAALFFASTAASAAVTEAGFTERFDIDLRGSAWAPANKQRSFTVDGLTVDAFKKADKPGKLWQDATDGLGIRSGESDEIDRKEWMKLTFDTPQKVTALMLTDLFDAPDGGANGESARVRLTLAGGDEIDLTAWGNLADQGNGEATLSFADLTGGAPVSMIRFFSGGERGDDYSVAGLHVTPLPGAVWALGAGLAALAGVRARRRRQQAA